MNAKEIFMNLYCIISQVNFWGIQIFQLSYKGHNLRVGKIWPILYGLLRKYVQKSVGLDELQKFSKKFGPVTHNRLLALIMKKMLKKFLWSTGHMTRPKAVNTHFSITTPTSGFEFFVTKFHNYQSHFIQVFAHIFHNFFHF